jgi:hypothetical protein
VQVFLESRGWWKPGSTIAVNALRRVRTQVAAEKARIVRVRHKASRQVTVTTPQFSALVGLN